MMGAHAQRETQNVIFGIAQFSCFPRIDLVFFFDIENSLWLANLSFTQLASVQLVNARGFSLLDSEFEERPLTVEAMLGVSRSYYSSHDILGCLG